MEELERRPPEGLADRLLVEGAEVDLGESDDDPAAEDAVAHFVHPMEEEFARLLDFYHISWLYEPTSFALNWSGGPQRAGLLMEQPEGIDPLRD